MGLATLALRTTVGGLFAAHGAQKLFGSFGGHGLDGTARFFESLELRPGRRHATAAGVAETAGGAALALGAATPLAGAALTGTMVTAIRRVHAQNGPWATNGGWEYNAVLIAAVTALVERPGPPALDRGRFGGVRWALFSLAAGVAGSYLATSPLLNEAPADATPEAGEGVPADPATAPAREAGGRFERSGARSAA
jgi:putative oxidoreductase